MFAGFDSGFMAFVVLIFSNLRDFYVDLRYHLQDTRINMCSQAFKPVVRHSPFYFSTLEYILRRLKVLLPRYE